MTGLSADQLEVIRTRLAVASSTSWYRDDVPLLLDELERLREALEFVDLYFFDGSETVQAIIQMQQRARLALGGADKGHSIQFASADAAIVWLADPAAEPPTPRFARGARPSAAWHRVRSINAVALTVCSRVIREPVVSADEPTARRCRQCFGWVVEQPLREAAT